MCSDKTPPTAKNMGGPRLHDSSFVSGREDNITESQGELRLFNSRIGRSDLEWDNFGDLQVRMAATGIQPAGVFAFLRESKLRVAQAHRSR